MPNFKSLASSVAEIINGNNQIIGILAVLAQGHTHFLVVISPALVNRSCRQKLKSLASCAIEIYRDFLLKTGLINSGNLNCLEKLTLFLD